MTSATQTKSRKRSPRKASKEHVQAKINASNRKHLDMPKKKKKLEGRFIKFDRDLAQAWIDHDREIRAKLRKDNRPVSPSNVKAKSDDMHAGCFMTTAQGPTVDQDTKVLDGQHTLLAVIRYYDECDEMDVKPEPVTLWVKEGEDPANFEFYDLGKKRSSEDVFSIEKVANPREMAIATRLVWLRVNGMRVRGGKKLSPHDTYEFSKKHPGLKKSAKFIMNFGVAEDSLPVKEMMSPGYAIALHYLMSNSDCGNKSASKMSDNFWEAVAEQDAVKHTGPWHLVRLINKIKSDKNLKMDRDALVDNTIVAFNKFVDGEKPTRIWTLQDGDKPVLGGLDQSEVPEEVE